MTKISNIREYEELLRTLKSKVSESKYRASLSVNKELVILYHHIGSEILKRQTTHGWGAKIINQLSKDLSSEFSDMKGFSSQNLKYMKKFASEYSANEIGQQLVDQLPWGHIIVLIYSIKKWVCYRSMH